MRARVYYQGGGAQSTRLDLLPRRFMKDFQLPLVLPPSLIPFSVADTSRVCRAATWPTPYVVRSGFG